MSRVAKNPIPIPNNVEITLLDQKIKLKGPKGEIEYLLPKGIQAESKEALLHLNFDSNERELKRLAGTTRANLNNKMKGISEGFVCSLRLQRIGARAQVQGNILVVNIGFSKPQQYDIPEGISITTPSATEIAISGIDIQQVNQVGSDIIRIRKPDAYKGMGIFKKGENIKLKVAKKK